MVSSPGDLVGVRGPYGSGWGLGQARGRDVLVLAGGLGLAPVRPIITSVLAERPAFGRAVVLIGARSPDTLLYRDEIEEWRGRLDIDIEVTVDSATPEWRGDVGVVTRLVGRAPVDPTNTVAFVCGPEVMMRFSALAVTDLGVAPSAVQLSMERNMHCAIGHCGHCQLGSSFICKDGPVLDWPQVEALLRVRER
ncbi:MAG: oxidoreductase [Actinomycetia bacterium]|nr:oxidoreductase [Actinomycetes bacterium]